MSARNSRNLSTGLAIVLAISVLVASCTTPQPAPKPSAKNNKGPRGSAPQAPGNPQGKDGREYKEIQSLFNKGNYEPALQKAGDFEARFPQSPLLGQVENLHGVALLATRNAIQAIPHFQKALQENSPGNPQGTMSPAFRQYILYNLATAQFEADLPGEAQQTVNEIQPELFDNENRIKFSQLRGHLLFKNGQKLEAVREFLEAGQFAIGVKPQAPAAQAMAIAKAREAHPALVSLIEQALQDINNTLALEQLYHDAENSPFADMILFKLVSREANENAFDKAEAYTRALQTKFPESPLRERAEDLVRTARGQAVVDPTAIGVLLPMKGKFSKFGAKNLQGIEMAFGVFGPVTGPAAASESKLNLVVEDSGEDAESAIKALDRLVLKHHVIAVIGPLLSKGIEQITQRAGELGVPLISLARHSGGTSDYVIQGGLTIKLQAQEVARYATQVLKLHRFAVVYPRDKIGDESAQHFWDAVESFGGEVVGAETYNPGETDFRQPIDKLSGLYYTEARQRELDALAKDRETNKVRKRTRKTEQFFSLKPIVDYEAVFLPDEPKVSGQIIPTFAYRDVDNIRFLGTSAWNSPELSQRAQNSVENAFFVDAFFAESPSPTVHRFMDRYRAIFAQEATVQEALSYDAASIVERAMVDGSPAANRQELLERLRATKDYAGVTGRIAYQGGQFARDLKVLTIHGGKVIEAATP